jgi:hypothetical protein
MNFETIRTILKESKLRDSTIDRKIYMLKAILKCDVFKGKIPTKLKAKSTIDAVIEYLDNAESMSVQSKLIYVEWYPRLIDTIYGTKITGDERFTQLKAKLKPLLVSKPKQGDMEELKKMRDEIKLTDKFTTEDIKYLILCLYTMIAPFRMQEYYNTIVIDENYKEPEFPENYYNLSTKTLIVSNYKTSDTYSRKEFVFPDELHNVVKSFHEKTGSSYLLKPLTTAKFTAPNMTNFMNRHFNTRSSMIRTLVVSNAVESGASKDEMSSLAKVMSHSEGIQRTTYSRFAKDKNVKIKELKSENENQKNEIEELKRQIAEMQKAK